MIVASSRRTAIQCTELGTGARGTGRCRCLADPLLGISVAVGGGHAGGQRAAAHLLELRARRHLLGEQRRLDAVEQPLEPADQLRLGDAQLGLGGHGIVGEGQRETLELVDQLRREAFLELLDRAPVDLLEPRPARLVQRGPAHLLQQLLDHAADAHDLGRLVDELSHRAVVGAFLAGGHFDRHAVGPDHDHPRLVVGAWLRGRSGFARRAGRSGHAGGELGEGVIAHDCILAHRIPPAHRNHVGAARDAPAILTSRDHRRAPAPPCRSVDDLPAVLGLLTAADQAVLGRTDFTVTEVESDLRDERKEHQGWYDDAGALVAYGWVSRVGESPKVEVDAYVHPSRDVAIGVALLAALEDRGRALAAEAGHDHVVFDTGAFRQDERTRHWLSARGFEVGTTFTRMRIDFDGPVDQPKQTAALTVRRSDASEGDLRLAHALDEKSFTEHYGEVAQDFDTFGKRFAEHGEGWSSLWLAELGGTPVGLLVGTRQFEEDDDAGYVRRLGVIPEGRGHGVAKALLRHYFSTSQREGRAAVLLHVDVANVTDALRVYESVGMRPILEIDAWTKRSPVDVVDSDTPL